MEKMTSEPKADTVKDDIARWKAMFGSWGADTIVSVLRFVVWIGLIGFIDLTDGLVKLVLSALWIVAFLRRYAVPHKVAIDETQFVVLLKRPLRIVRWNVAALGLLMFFTAPWAEALIRNLVLQANARPLDIGSTNDGNISIIVVFFAFCVIAVTTATYPLVEEFFTRGWLFAILKERYSSLVTVVVTSAVFVGIHLSLNPELLLMRFLFGIALGYAVLITGSVWTAVTMHYAWDLSLFYFRSPATRDIQQVQYIGLTPTPGRAIAALILSVVCCILLLAHARRRTRQEGTSPA